MSLAEQTHCSRGHELESGLLLRKRTLGGSGSTGFVCAKCRREDDARYRARRKRKADVLPPDRGARIPGARLVPLIDEYLSATGTLQRLPAHARRTASRARLGEPLGLAQVDHLLVAIDRVDAWYCELDDLYFEGAAA